MEIALFFLCSLFTIIASAGDCTGLDFLLSLVFIYDDRIFRLGTIFTYLTITFHWGLRKCSKNWVEPKSEKTGIRISPHQICTVRGTSESDWQKKNSIHELNVYLSPLSPAMWTIFHFCTVAAAAQARHRNLNCLCGVWSSVLVYRLLWHFYFWLRTIIIMLSPRLHFVRISLRRTLSSARSLLCSESFVFVTFMYNCAVCDVHIFISSHLSVWNVSEVWICRTDERAHKCIRLCES